MPKVNYDNVEPNIAEVDVDGTEVRVKWKCPVSGSVVCESSAAMKPATSTARAASTQVKKTLLYEVMVAFNRFISSTFGGTAGRIAASATTMARAGADRAVGKPVYNTATEHAAVVDAFRKVENRFKWDEDRELFINAS